jgi:uncharacterized membrane protein
LVEVLKRSGALRKEWGLLIGAFFLNRAINAAVGRRPFLRTGWVGLGAVVGGLVLKYGLAAFVG